jgi:hypothetical protein
MKTMPEKMSQEEIEEMLGETFEDMGIDFEEHDWEEKI